MVRRLLAVSGLCVLGVIVFVVVARATSKSVDGIPCEVGEGSGYHVHAHLTIVINGTHRYYPPANTGIEPLHFCLYWLHTHDNSGIIHIEAPHRISPTLGEFFDIWGQPLSRQRISRWTVPANGQSRFYVGNTLYPGDPRKITLRNHTTVTAEVGPRFIPPPRVNFQGL